MTTLRQAANAGRFYQADPPALRRQARDLLDRAELPERLTTPVLGAIVPHAGWVFSGPLAAVGLKAVAADEVPKTVVLFGADHWGTAARGEVFAAGAWRTPLGEASVDEELASTLLDAGGPLRANPEAHAREHSLEVLLPLLQTLAPQACILPIAVPPTAIAVQIGQTVGQAIATGDRRVRVVGSTDLTHHGGHFGNPGGHGAEGVQWTEQNDRRIIHRMEAMDADGVLQEATEHRNACGAGAIAATIAATTAMGATRGVLLEYTNSYRVLQQMPPGGADDTTVGYAAVAFA